MVSCFYTKFNKTLFIYFFAFISVFDTIFHLATEERAYGLGRDSRRRRPPQRSAENRRAQRRRRPDNLLETRRLTPRTAEIRRRLFARASRGHIVAHDICLPLGKLGFIKVLGLYIF